MQQPALVADIGGTHARFALTDIALPVPAFEREMAFTDAQFPNLPDAARHYLDCIDAHPRRAALAVASPIEGDRVTLTNREWSFRCSELKQLLGLDQLRIINDFAAIAWAAPHIAAADRMALQGQLESPPRGPVTLIGAGTGLGVALLTGSGEDGWHVVPTEGGHASFAPTDADERTLAAWLQARFGRASNERVLSGDGLRHVDAALRGIDPVATPAAQPGLREAGDITGAALAGSDMAALHALQRFCRIYGAVAGDAALLHGARSVFVAGGVVLHFLDFFRASDFMAGFTAKGRHADYMRQMAVQVVTHPNPGLLGAAVAVRALHGAADTRAGR